MQVILLEKVENLGNMGDLVKVKSGFGRNFLLPKGKAALATPENIKVFEARRAELEKKQAADLTAAQARAAELADMRLEIVSKAGTEGKLFGSIGTIDIAESCTERGVPLQRSEVRLPNGPIRLLGEHEVELHLHADVTVSIRVQVIGEDGATGPALGAEPEAPADDAADAQAVAVESEDSDATGDTLPADEGEGEGEGEGEEPKTDPTDAA